jgi:hypothetical protein
LSDRAKHKITHYLATTARFREHRYFTNLTFFFWGLPAPAALGGCDEKQKRCVQISMPFFKEVHTRLICVKTKQKMVRTMLKD